MIRTVQAPAVENGEQMNTLPPLTLILTPTGQVWQRTHTGGWVSNGHLSSGHELLAAVEKDGRGPAVVIWEPGAAWGPA